MHQATLGGFGKYDTADEFLSKHVSEGLIERIFQEVLKKGQIKEMIPPDGLRNPVGAFKWAYPALKSKYGNLRMDFNGRVIQESQTFAQALFETLDRLTEEPRPEEPSSAGRMGPLLRKARRSGLGPELGQISRDTVE